ncbi:DUF4181 domain-containing protein [Bacillus cereus]|uniref:DUF4181 domain-containing protein n=1 Tax=Bacillus cereus TaxID=1396 RepID=UPI00356FD6D0
MFKYRLEVALFIIYFIGSFIYIYSVDNANIGYAIFTYFGVLNILRIWMEWKYDRESKEYVISFLFILFYLICIFVLYFLS